MNLAVLLLAACSAGVYAAAIVLLFTRRWIVHVGSFWWIACAVIAFALERAFSENGFLTVLTTFLLLASLAAIVRNSSDALASLLALVPISVMFITVIDPFFQPATQGQLNAASIAILCAPAPMAFVSALLRQSTSFRSKSAR